MAGIKVKCTVYMTGLSVGELLCFTCGGCLRITSVLVCHVWWFLNCATLEYVLVVCMKFTDFWYVMFHSLLEVNCILEGALPHSSAWKVAAARAEFFEMPKKNSVRLHCITPQKAVIFIGNKLIRIPHLTSMCHSFCVRCSSAQTTWSLQGSNFLFKPSFSNSSSKDNVSPRKFDEKSS